MSDTDTLAPELSADENKYFESNGNAEIPNPETISGDGNGEGGAEGDSGAGKSGPAKETTVPHAALHEERTKRKDLERKTHDLEKKIAEFTGKFAIIDKLRIPEQDAEPEITPESDIFGFVRKQGETLTQLTKRMADDEAARKANENEVTQRNNLVSSYRADAVAFEAKTPDFKAAYNHLLASRAKELVAMGYDDPAALHEAVTNDEMNIAAFALEKGKSPAEIIYNLAVGRGYKKSNGNGDAASRLDNIERGQQANKSLSNTGGASGDGDMTAAILMKMPMDEFEKYCEKNPAKVKRLMGG